MICTTHIATPDAQRIAKRLFNHWQHKFEVQAQPDLFQISMPDATLFLTPSPDRLEVKLETQREDYQVLEKVIIDHLDRMAQQKFQVEWQYQP